ncbi:MAG: hypothetical protein JXB48_17155, partial [Candidatus Latescibacteria bacterium]|nr:hypothetical protein [Candidatus Latescibacterota bacterium]
PEALDGTDRVSKSFAGFYEFGSFSGSIVGELSWISAGNLGGPGIIFVRGNVGARVVLGGLPEKEWNIPEQIARQVLKKIENNLNSDIITIEQNAKEKQISEQKYNKVINDAVNVEIMSNFSLQSDIDSKWPVDSNTFVLGRRTEYDNEHGIIIGIDMCEFESEDLAKKASAIRTSYIPAVESLGDKPPVFSITNQSSIDTLITNWETRRDYTALSKKIISGISVIDNIVVHIYQYAPHEIDKVLFTQVTSKIADQISF